jgi:hypothetical protein
MGLITSSLRVARMPTSTFFIPPVLNASPRPPLVIPLFP